jgi:Fucose permease
MQLPNLKPAKTLTIAADMQMEKKISYVLPLVLIISMFFMWGMAGNLNDILIKQFKKSFELTDLQSGFVQSAFYMGYFLLAIPASIVMRKYNYITGIIIGLILTTRSSCPCPTASAAAATSRFRPRPTMNCRRASRSWLPQLPAHRVLG